MPAEADHDPWRSPSNLWTRSDRWRSSSSSSLSAFKMAARSVAVRSFETKVSRNVS